MTYLKSSIFLVLLVLVSACGKVSTELLPNEKIMYSFETEEGKTVILAKDSTNKYLVYRLCDQHNVELQYPLELNEESFQKFRHSYSFISGNRNNPMIKHEYITFEAGGFVYKIYDEYTSFGTEKTKEIGIRTANKHSGEESISKGIVSSISGSLEEFKTSGLIESTVVE